MSSTLPIRNRVLLADTDAIYCVSARRALDKRGYIVTIAHDGTDLLARYSPERYDIIVVGVTLKRPSGLDILRHVQKRSASTPVILLCDENTVELAKAGVNEGAFAYFITSEEDYDALGDAIAEALEPDLQFADEEGETDASSAAESDESLVVVASQCMRELIQSAGTKPLPETLKHLAETSAQILQAKYGIVLLAHPSGLQIVTPFEPEDNTAAVHEFLERANDGFAYRVASARKTLIDAMPTFPEEPPEQFIGTPIMLKDQWLGVLVAYPLPPNQQDELERVRWFELFATLGALAVETAKIRDENVRLSPNDPTTGILKRETFMEMADREFRRSWRYSHPIATILVDVDDMSAINLRHGHEFGDQVLREVANVCRNVVRSIDLIGRYEGDSILILLLMTGRDGARIVAERLRVGINAIRLGIPPTFQVTATLGVCSYPRNNCASVFDLFAVAQEAQKTARRIGPNQIVYG